MTNYRVLILGSSGFLGKTIFSELNKVCKVSHTGLRKKKLLLDKFKNLKKLMISNKFDYVINCVALTNVDKCEQEKTKAFNLNVKIIKNILELKKKNNLKFKLIHFSSDQVYNSKNLSYYNNENDFSKKFINYYSKTKIISEKICLKEGKNEVLIFRTNFIGRSYSTKKSFTDWLYKNITQNNRISLAANSFITPLRANTIAKVLVKIINRNLFKHGVYNLGSDKGMSKSEIGIYFIKKINKKYSNYDIKSINELTKIKRPLNMMMCSKKFSKNFKLKLPTLLQELKLSLKEYENKN